jgi:cytochrome c oxidase subunit 2
MNLPKLAPNSGRSTNAMIWIAVAGVAIVIGGIVIASLQPMFFPVVASAEAEQVDALFRFMLAIGGMIFLLVEGLLLYSIIRFRARPGDISDGPPIQGNTTLEFIWTLIPAIIVFVLTIYAWSVWTDTHSIKRNERTVEAVGQRYAWAFNYELNTSNLPPDVTVEQLPPQIRVDLEDGGMQFSYPQLATWVGQPMAVSLRTEDVNHAFWIPAMRVKQDLLAGRTTTIRFTPTEAGVYRIVCAELCGSGHGAMAGEVLGEGEEATLLGAWLVVYPDEETYMREFFNVEAFKRLFPPVDPVDLGRAILASNQYPCATCHVLDDLGWAGALGPSLNGIGDRAGTRVPGQTAYEYLYTSIRHPYDYLVPPYGPIMPQFNDEESETNYMPESDLQAIIAYLCDQTAQPDQEICPAVEIAPPA